MTTGSASQPARGRPRFLITGGGTGGHVYPGLAVAEQLQRLAPGCEVRFAGTGKGIESQLVPRAGYRFSRVPASGVRGLGAKARLLFLLNFAAGLLRSLLLLVLWRPDLVLGTGGYVIGPVMTAARLLGIRCVLQEQNSVPGSANRLVARWAERVYLGFAAAADRFGAAKCVTTGNPVRGAFTRESDPGPGDWHDLGAPGGRVLVFGGSGGARTLNDAVIGAVERWPGDPGHGLLAQTGGVQLDEVRTAVAQSGRTNVRVEPYLLEMVQALRWADLVVCRAGAMTLAELQAMGKPAVLVPFPFATDDHQTHNARDCERAGAAVVLPDAECTPDRFLELTAQLLADPQRLQAMGAAARGLSRPGAADEIARDMLSLLGIEPKPEN